MNNPVHIHALRYAVEATKVFQMQEYKKKYPYYFENATLETRPATHKDYFIPPSIANQCIVVVKTQFNEMDCKRFGCYKLKKNWEICEENDPLQWIRIGNKYELACQQSCKDHSIDTEWYKGRCILSNPYKKALASMPENIFERASRHIFHGGFDIVDGHLKINKRYCDAYGLDFVNGDCIATGGQKFGEWLFGKTVIRAAKVGNLQPLHDQPPPIPDYIINYSSSKSKNKRIKRSVSINDGNFSASSSSKNVNFFHDVAIELTTDLGRDVSEYAVEKFLKHKAPKLLSKGIDKIATKIALKHSVSLAMKEMGTFAIKTLGKSVAIVTAIYAVYELISGLLDAFDPFDYLKVIDKNMLEKMDKELDYAYYQDKSIRPELTPEYIWDHDILPDDEESLNFMISKIEEYLNALKTIPPNEYRKHVEKKPLQFIWLEKENHWNNTLFKCIIFIIICLTFLFLEWIHIWSCLLFFAMLYYNAY